MPSSAGVTARAKGHNIEVANLSRGTLLGTSVRVAETALGRAIGLLGETRLDPGAGLLIDPSSGIHTFGMRFSVDVLALDGGLRVRSVHENVRPLRIAGLSWWTRCIVELPVGAIKASATRVGDQLELRAARKTVPPQPLSQPAGAAVDPIRVRSPKRARRHARWLALAIVLALACYGMSYRFMRPAVLRANPTPDFACYYRSAAMVLAGDGVSIYDRKAQHAYDLVLRRELAATRFDSRPFLAPPFALLYYLPVAWLPFARAQSVWYVLNVALLLWLPFLLRPVFADSRFPAAAMLAPALFLPVEFTLIEGQNTILLMLLLALSLVSFAKRQMVYCGCFLALASFKPHLTLPLLAGFLLSAEWSVVGSFFCTAVALAGASAAIVGWRSMLTLGRVVASFDRLPAAAGGDSPWAMPNLRGALYLLLHDRISADVLMRSTLAASILLTVAAALIFARCRKQAPELSFALLVTTAVLTSYHGYFHEVSLLLLSFVLLTGFVTRHRITWLCRLSLPLILLLYLAPLVARSFQQAVLIMVAAMFGVMAVLTMGALATRHTASELPRTLPTAVLQPSHLRVRWSAGER